MLFPKAASCILGHIMAVKNWYVWLYIKDYPFFKEEIRSKPCLYLDFPVCWNTSICQGMTGIYPLTHDYDLAFGL